MRNLINPPTTDFNAVRDGRTALPLYIDVDLSTARSISANSALIIPIAGNSFFADADTTNGGIATIHFQDTSLGITSAPFTVSPGFIANVGFTQLLIENTSQPGKKLRIFYGVDIDFQAGVNSTISISGTVIADSPKGAFYNYTLTVTPVSSLLLAPRPDRTYLIIQNKHASGIIYVCANGAATVSNGIMIPPGASWEISGAGPTNSWYVIGDIASNSSVVVCEGRNN